MASKFYKQLTQWEQEFIDLDNDIIGPAVEKFIEELKEEEGIKFTKIKRLGFKELGFTRLTELHSNCIERYLVNYIDKYGDRNTTYMDVDYSYYVKPNVFLNDDQYLHDTLGDYGEGLDY